MSATAIGGRRKVAVRVGINCAVGLTCAHVLAAAAVAAAVISLNRSGLVEVRDLLNEKNLIVAVILVAVSSVASAVAGAVDVAPRCAGSSGARSRATLNSARQCELRTFYPGYAGEHRFIRHARVLLQDGLHAHPRLPR
jgi:hypothetical protein